MELQVKQFTIPEVIEFNFEELKNWLEEKTKQYENHVYTDGQLQVAKTDLATLRKVKKALSDKRIEIKKECLKPYEEVEAKFKILDEIISKPIAVIDEQVKSYDEAIKQAKKEQIISFFEGCHHFEWLRFEQIFNEKWLNVSVKIPAIEKEITERLQQVENDLKTLSNLPEFGFEATEVYKDTLDINKAITEGQRLSDMQKRKAEAEAETKVEDVPQTPSNNAPVDSVEDVNKQWISFKALMSMEDAVALKKFFDDRNIVFEKI